MITDKRQDEFSTGNHLVILRDFRLRKEFSTEELVEECLPLLATLQGNGSATVPPNKPLPTGVHHDATTSPLSPKTEMILLALER